MGVEVARQTNRRVAQNLLDLPERHTPREQQRRSTVSKPVEGHRRDACFLDPPLELAGEIRAIYRCAGVGAED